MTDEEIYDLWAETKPPMLNNFARAIEAKVREECAVICEGISEYKNDKHKSYEPHSKEWYAAGGASLGADDCAEAIRARGKE